jgi:hypothetical protein
MPPKDLLGVLVRFGGLSVFMFGIFDLYFVFMKLLGFPTSSVRPIEQIVLAAIFYFIFGLGILFCAKWIVKLAYWRDDSQKPQ